MVVMQTYDDAALLERAAAANHKLAFEIKDFQGQHLMQFDYKTFGTRFEFYRYTPEDNWWGNPLNGAYNDPRAVEDILGAEVAVENPGGIAETAASTFSENGTAPPCTSSTGGSTLCSPPAQYAVSRLSM